MGKVSVPLNSLSGGEKEKKETLTLNDKNNQPTQVSHNTMEASPLVIMNFVADSESSKI